MTPTIIVTRHEHLVTILRERGVVDADTPVLTHVDRPEQVEGQHVIGVLPHHLSSRAASVTEIPMRWTEKDREAMQRGDVDLDGTRAAAGDPITYVVHRVHGGGVDTSRPRWLAIAAAYEHVERCGECFGAGPVALRSSRSFRGLDLTFIVDGSQQASAHVIESRGVWRPNCRGPWLDGYGREGARSTPTRSQGQRPGRQRRQSGSELGVVASSHGDRTDLQRPLRRGQARDPFAPDPDHA